jgi:molybdopterin/thiamine biosynthesis adenylyltransferase
MLTPEQLERYQNQLSLPGMGEQAQIKLSNSRVLVAGLSGSGAIAAQLLAVSGVGTIGLLDDSVIALADLHRDILSSSDETGKSRIESAKRRLNHLNPDCMVELHELQLDAHNAEELLTPYHLILDGLDDWQKKLLASDTAMHLNIPMIHCGITGFQFQVFSMVPGRSACLRCLFHQLGREDLSRQDKPAINFGPAATMAGSLQASEALHIIAESGVTGCDELIQFDCLRREFYTVRELGPRADCPDCGRTTNRNQ